MDGSSYANESLMGFIINDWAGNRITQKSFESFDDAWDYILGELTDKLGLVEEDYQEYHVIEME